MNHYLIIAWLLLAVCDIELAKAESLLSALEKALTARGKPSEELDGLIQ